MDVRFQTHFPLDPTNPTFLLMKIILGKLF